MAYGMHFGALGRCNMCNVCSMSLNTPYIHSMLLTASQSEYSLPNTTSGEYSDQRACLGHPITSTCLPAIGTFPLEIPKPACLTREDFAEYGSNGLTETSVTTIVAPRPPGEGTAPSCAARIPMSEDEEVRSLLIIDADAVSEGSLHPTPIWIPGPSSIAY